MAQGEPETRYSESLGIVIDDFNYTGWTIGRINRMSDFVGIDYRCAQLAKNPGNRTLAGADPAG